MNLLDRSDTLKPTATLLQLVDTPRNDVLEITNGSVTWRFDFLNGRLRYGGHSLQTFDIVERYMKRLGFEAAIAPSRLLVTESTRWSALQAPWGIGHLEQLPGFIQELVTRQLLSWSQANILVNQLAKDSLESALWLTSGSTTWLSSRQEEPSLVEWQGIDFRGLINDSLKRLRVWQTLASYIRSPHEVPIYLSSAPTGDTVPSGALPRSTLTMLQRLMTGISLRQLAHILKQDELKLAQLLCPYVQQGILTFQPASTPWNHLPLIPAESPSVPKPSAAPSARMPSSTPELTTPDSPQRSHRPTPIVSNPYAPEKRVEKKGLNPPRPTINARIETYRIVCIDDSTSMLETLQGYLQGDRYEVTTLDNPMQAVSTMFSFRPDLVLMDVSMPGINGNRLCQILKRSSAFKTTPIIMVSSNAGALDKAKARAMGASDYLAKPFSQADLLHLIEMYLQGAN